MQQSTPYTLQLQTDRQLGPIQVDIRPPESQHLTLAQPDRHGDAPPADCEQLGRDRGLHLGVRVGGPPGDQSIRHAVHVEGTRIQAKVTLQLLPQVLAPPGPRPGSAGLQVAG